MIGIDNASRNLVSPSQIDGLIRNMESVLSVYHKLAIVPNITYWLQAELVEFSDIPKRMILNGYEVSIAK